MCRPAAGSRAHTYMRRFVSTPNTRRVRSGGRKGDLRAVPCGITSVEQDSTRRHADGNEQFSVHRAPSPAPTPPAGPETLGIGAPLPTSPDAKPFEPLFREAKPQNTIFDFIFTGNWSHARPLTRSLKKSIAPPHSRWCDNPTRSAPPRTEQCAIGRYTCSFGQKLCFCAPRARLFLAPVQWSRDVGWSGGPARAGAPRAGVGGSVSFGVGGMARYLAVDSSIVSHSHVLTGTVPLVYSRSRSSRSRTSSSPRAGRTPPVRPLRPPPTGSIRLSMERLQSIAQFHALRLKWVEWTHVRPATASHKDCVPACARVRAAVQVAAACAQHLFAAFCLLHWE